MARNPVAAVRQLVRNGRKLYAPSRILHPLRSTSVQTTSPPIQSSIKPFSVNLHFSDLPFLQNRSLASSSGPSNIVLIKSEEGFKTAISKAQDGSSPAIFYFTAVWCGPCRVISPLIEELSGQYPHVTTYKVDVDEDYFDWYALTDVNCGLFVLMKFVGNSSVHDYVAQFEDLTFSCNLIEEHGATKNSSQEILITTKITLDIQHAILDTNQVEIEFFYSVRDIESCEESRQQNRSILSLLHFPLDVHVDVLVLHMHPFIVCNIVYSILQEGLGNTLSLLNITSVPTFHFFQNGKKAAEVVGADAARLKNTIENLYK
ncbi:hypothetical protein FEM48_Zijuj01G0161300 [Ziziphus jujuba var. spinosa]|uniref:Thioredoxin domain-containing protein n=1 Tax=Ziziphus jujuba var. spinosa TaxID=714518 RepID=A0A978W284_ZIZJJ|nr:hypothetical protein FEM48_Zijuj01G0161300 [Ziziphus jujuba var. spinosa]